MTPSPNCINLLKSFEGCRLVAYQDQAGVWTIGWGSTRYKNGNKVAELDTIYQQEADDLLWWEVGLKAAAVNGFKIRFNQNQFDALTDFAYNLGVGALTNSTLIKKARMNVSDPTIHDEFLKWVFAGGKKNIGLMRRRSAESAMYFTPINTNLAVS